MADARDLPEFSRARKALHDIREWIPNHKLRAELIGRAIHASRELVEAIESGASGTPREERRNG